MAERKGFEPLRGSYPPTGFQDRTLKPLGYLSKNSVGIYNQQTNTMSAC